MLIGGEWRAAASSQEIEVVNPATEEVAGTVPSGDTADVDLAVETARRAFADWSRTDVEARAHILGKAADLIEERAADVAAVLTSEQGKPIAEARGEVTHLAHGVRYYAEAATKVTGTYQGLPSTFGPAYGQVIRRPMGVCAAITPYNFPLTLLGTKVAPALAMGNTVVAKPAATTPLATLEVARLFAEAGVPDGVLNVVTGRGSVIGDALVGHRDVRRVAFTGSTEVGRRVAGIAAPQMKRLSLELGGSDPVIVCEDADIDAAVKAVIIGRYWNAGQACLGCKRVYVHAVRLRRLRRAAGRPRRALRARRRHREGGEAAPAHGPDPHPGRPRRARRPARGRRRQGRRAPRGRRHGRPPARLVPGARGRRGARSGLAAGARGGLRPGPAGVPLHGLRRRAAPGRTTRPTAWARRSGPTTSAGSTGRRRRSIPA